MVSNKLSLANLNNLIDISKFLSIKISSAHKNRGILTHKNRGIITQKKTWHNNAKKSHALTTCDFIIIE